MTTWIRLCCMIAVAAGLAGAMMPRPAIAGSDPVLPAGTWALVSIYEENSSGEELDRWGDNPTGHFIADGAGHFVFMLVGRNIIRLGKPLSCGHAKDYEGITLNGRYTADPDRHTMTLAIDDALPPVRDDSRRTASIRLDGDDLDFVSSAEESPTLAFYAHLRWKRVR